MNHKYTKKQLIDMLEACEASSPTIVIQSHVDLYPLFLKDRLKPVEHFWIVTLSSVGEVIKKHIVSKGLVNRTLVNPTEVFRLAIRDRASFFIAIHNHPSGNLEFSEDDKHLCERLTLSGEIMGIKMKDFLICSRKGFKSINHVPASGKIVKVSSKESKTV